MYSQVLWKDYMHLLASKLEVDLLIYDLRSYM